MKNILLKFLYYLGITGRIRQTKFKNQDITVLSLHRIHPEIDFAWNPIKPKTFEILLQYVQKNYQVVTFGQLEQAIEKNTKPLLVLSFDDGYLDFMDYALPLLKQYQIPCNHNFVIDCLDNNKAIWTQELNQIFNHLYERKQPIQLTFDDKIYTLSGNPQGWYATYIQCLRDMLATPKAARLAQIAQWKTDLNLPQQAAQMMNWDNLKTCLATGLVEIGSHTVTHDSLATIEDKTQLEWELKLSKERLEKELDIPITILALPNGQSSELIRQMAQQLDYQFLLEINEANYHHQKDEKLHIISRINIVEEAATMLYLRIENVQNKIKSWLKR